MKRYRSFLYTLLLVAAAYAVLGNLTWIRGSYELFPIFAWELFSYVPGEVTDYGVRITQVDGIALDPPRYFEEANAVVGNPHSIEAYVVIQSLGRAIEGEEADTVTQARATLESLYLNHAGPVAYEVYRRRASPLERVRDGVFDEERLLANFVTGGD